MNVSIANDAGLTTAHVSGEVDADNCSVFAASLLAIDVDGDALVVDLGDLGFIDSSGISEMLRVRSDYADRGIRVTIARPSAPVHRVLEITGLLELFDIPATPS